MRLKPKYLLVAVLIFGVCYALSLMTTNLTPALPQIAASIEGDFPVNGQYPGDPLHNAPGVRLWGSWAGDDVKTGTLTLGPFAAPRMLHLAIGGYPGRPGNEIYVALAGTSERQPITLESDVGERWRLLDVELPPAWLGRNVVLVARDRATMLGGWIGISEPLTGGRIPAQNGLVISLAAWTLNGLLLGIVWFAALKFLVPRNWVAPHWLPLVAAALVAACGYVTFWVFFAHLLTGKIFAFVLIAAALAYALRGTATAPAALAESAAISRLLLAIGFCYLALLHVFPSSRDIYELAANRFMAELPGDNALPHDLLAKPIFIGDRLRGGVDWLSSDRPPLQAGWQLMVLPAAAALRMNHDYRIATCMAAIWFQSTWIFAAYGLFRTLRLSRAKSCAWIAVLAGTGFFLLHTVFTWPKLSAAAFTCGAFAFWVFGAKGEAGEARVDSGSRATDIALGAMFAALGWLSHGGIAFSLLALAPWILWRLVRGEIRPWLVAGVIFAGFALPWMAYQKFYDPPGNRLFKWHLGGVMEKDDRGTWQTIRDSYRAIGWKAALEKKRQNFETQYKTRWQLLFDFSPAHRALRRNDEFFITARGLTWWAFAPGVLLLAAASSKVRARLVAGGRRPLLLFAWAMLTIVIWCLLMFNGYSAAIHQGSYATMVALFVAFSVCFELASPWLIILVAALQVATCATTWVLSTERIGGPPQGAPIAIAAALAVLAVVIAEFRRPEPEPSS